MRSLREGGEGDEREISQRLAAAVSSSSTTSNCFFFFVSIASSRLSVWKVSDRYDRILLPRHNDSFLTWRTAQHASFASARASVDSRGWQEGEKGGNCM